MFYTIISPFFLEKCEKLEKQLHEFAYLAIILIIKKVSMKKLAFYLKPFTKQCILGPLCKLMEAILELLLPTIMAFVINNGVQQHNTQLVLTLGITMIVMVFIGFAFSMICQYQAALASQGFGTNVRNAMMKHIQTFSYQDIDTFGTSSLNNRLTNDVNQLQIAVAMMIRLVIRSPFIIIGAIFMSMMLDLTLSLILIASVPFIVLILYIFIRYSSPLYHAYQKKLDVFARILDDNFSGVRVIRAFVSQHQEKHIFEEHVEDLQKQMMRVSKYAALLNPLTALVVNGSIVLLLWSGILQINAGQMEAGTIIAFINYATQILIALIATSNLIVIFTKASASAQRVCEVLEYKVTMKEGTQELHTTTKQAISFSHVGFCYEDGEAALHDISFEVAKGETIGMIGGTGSGKTTLVHLLSRFYDVQQGLITLFDTPIQTISYASLRKHIAIVSQQNELFSDTIEANLCMGEFYSQKELDQALEDCQAMEFVQALPSGIHTRLERGGSNLSGGQKQRLCIARALLKKASILILDDSCSALDFKTDATVRSNLQTYDMTRVIVSQRVGTLWNCDRILVLHDGNLVSNGTHQQLYDTCDVYREICMTQQIGRDAS